MGFGIRYMLGAQPGTGFMRRRCSRVSLVFVCEPLLHHESRLCALPEPGLVILVVNWVKASADKKVRWAPSASGGGIRLGEDMWRKSGSRMDCPVRPGNDDLMALIRWSSTDQITPPFLPPRPPAKTSYAAPQARARGCARSSAGRRRRCRSPAPRGRAL